MLGALRSAGTHHPMPLPLHSLRCAASSPGRRGEDLLETLLRTPPPEPSRASMDDLGQQLQRGASSSSEGGAQGAAGAGLAFVRCPKWSLAAATRCGVVMVRARASFASATIHPAVCSPPTPPPRPAELYRAASFNTKVGVLRSQSPFYRLQQSPGAGPSSAPVRPGSAGAAGATAAAAAEGGIELKPTSANVLLGQAHLEGRGKFMPAHPVPHHSPGAAVRRVASPLQRSGSAEAG